MHSSLYIVQEQRGKKEGEKSKRGVVKVEGKRGDIWVSVGQLKSKKNKKANKRKQKTNKRRKTK